MCDLTAAYSTVVATTGVLGEVRERWAEFRAVHRFDLREAHVTTLEHLGHHWAGIDAPAVMTVHHGHVPGHLVANELQIELAVEYGYEVMSEPGYRTGVAYPNYGAPSTWSVVLHDEPLGRARQQLALSEPLGNGARVAVLDTGDDGDFMLDMLEEKPVVTAAVDAAGHGSAICALVHALRPNAEIHPVRVLRIDPGDSTALLLGLIAVLWPDEDGKARYDAVNVSLSRQLVDECSSSLGATLAFVRALCGRHGAIPPVIAAAGNRTSGQQFGYPAALPDAIAAVALDWDGNAADYNVEVPPGILREAGYGGTREDPFGTVDNGHQQNALYGSSFAAALVTCRYLAD
jgi:hypothetical protein